MKDVRIIIEGSRGKSGLVELLTKAIGGIKGHKNAVGKVSGKETAVFFNNEKIIIKRKDNKFLIDQENREILNKFSSCKFKVFENQALSAYTMKAFHLLFKPNIILIPNIRYEHQNVLGKNISDMAESFAGNFKGSELVITTEQKEEVLNIFKKFAKKYKTKLVVIRKREIVPGSQIIGIIDYLLKYLFNEELCAIEKTNIVNALKNKMKIQKSNKGIFWFKGSKINDVESSENVFNYLQNQTDLKFCFVCYFRKDRSERTEAFIPLIKKMTKNDKVEKIFIKGYHLDSLPKNPKIKKLGCSNETLINYCKRKNLVLVTAVNGVNDYMIKLESELEN